MSLLMNEDFSIYQLRLGYLNQIHDGVGERLINLNPAVLNNPAFRTAGWVPDLAAIKRCYSPPIPTGTSDISNEYFQRPRRPTRRGTHDAEDGNEGGGMLTGQQGSEDTLGPAGLHANERKRERRRRKEQLEEDDSSDLSDDSDEDERGPAQSIKFSKMPLRHRVSTSPVARTNAVRGSVTIADGPAVLITSPSRRPDQTLARLRSGSMGAVDAVRQRARRDTTTSSEMSSDNELAPPVFKRNLPGRPGKGPSMLPMEDDIEEEDEREALGNSDLEEDDDDIDVGEASDLSDDEFGALVDSPTLLGLGAVGVDQAISTSPIRPPPDIPPAITPANASPKKAMKDSFPRLSKLPPGQRPKSMAQPVSMISKLLKGNVGGSKEKPFQRFAQHSGKGEASPLWIKIYAPFSEKPSDPIEVPLRRTKNDRPVTVAELIGLALWRYEEEACKPVLPPQAANINHWTLRIVEDEEIDFDFPALARTRPVVDFTSNNNRPPQRRARDKPWDEFGLVKATEQQFKENEELTPQLNLSESSMPPTAPTPQPDPASNPALPRTTSFGPPSTAPLVLPALRPAHPITGPSFAPSALRKDSSTPVQDLPQREARSGAPRIGAPRTVLVHYTDPQSFATRTERFPTTADSYIAEIFDQSCKRLNLDKALQVLKVHGTQTVAPADRTVEALGDRLHLDLVRRRFMGGNLPGGDGMFGLGLSGSPGSTSPNAPLELTPANATPGQTAGGKKKGMKAAFSLHPLAAAQQKSELNATTASMLNLDLTSASATGFGGKRYAVLRKQPLSFAGAHPRTLIITPEYMTIMPASAISAAPASEFSLTSVAPVGGVQGSGKVTNVPMTSIIGAKVSRKHPKMVRILVFRERETKRYDFEVRNEREALEVANDVRRGMEAFGGGGGVEE